MSTGLKVGDKVRIVGSNSVPNTIGMQGRIILIDGGHMPFRVSIDGTDKVFWYQGEFLEKVEEPAPAQPTPPDLSKYRCRDPKLVPVSLFDRLSLGQPWLLVYRLADGRHSHAILNPELQNTGSENDCPWDLVPIEEPKPEPRSWDTYAWLVDGVPCAITGAVHKQQPGSREWIRVRITEVLDG